MHTLQDLHKRFSSYLHNVENQKSIITNNEYTLVAQEGNKSMSITALMASIINPSEFYRHLAIFFETFGENEILFLSSLLENYVDKDEFKNIKISGLIRYEDNRIIENEDILFTGKIFIETNFINIDKAKAYQMIEKINIKYKGKKLSFRIRENMDWEIMNKENWPSVFLCHDSKDKELVELLYWELKKNSINVWYDKYSLVLGDSLTEKISGGLNEAKHGVVFISKSFLSNEKWVKFELQTLMSKQIYNNTNTIIPVWLDIEEKDLEKHHWLREKLAVKFSEGIDIVTKKIIEAIK
jgi:hypothetical protein